MILIHPETPTQDSSFPYRRRGDLYTIYRAGPELALFPKDEPFVERMVQANIDAIQNPGGRECSCGVGDCDARRVVACQHRIIELTGYLAATLGIPTNDGDWNRPVQQSCV